MSAVEKRVDVIVVSYNSSARLRGCIELLAYEPCIGAVVVDNASQDDSIASVADLPIRLLPLENNVGFGSGCNVGWRATHAPYVLFLNPDARMSPADVLQLADVAQRTGAGAVAPRIVDSTGELEYSLRRFPEVRSIYGQAFFAHRLFPTAEWTDEVVRDSDAYAAQGQCEWASGACLLVRREVLERLDGFDEGFFMYSEDVDICRRIWNGRDRVIYTPEATCSHAGGGSAPRWRLTPVLARSRVRYARKHFGRVRAGLYRCGVALNALTHIFVGRGLQGRFGHAQAFAAALRPGTQP